AFGPAAEEAAEAAEFQVLVLVPTRNTEKSTKPELSSPRCESPFPPADSRQTSSPLLGSHFRLSASRLHQHRESRANQRNHAQLCKSCQKTTRPRVDRYHHQRKQ